VDWYYRAGLVVGLIWATARVLGAYGEAARELDINFVFGFLLTTGGWAALFLVIDRVAKFLGWRRVQEPGATAAPAPVVESTPAPRQASATTPARTARRKRR
jgi:hypothetical protein